MGDFFSNSIVWYNVSFGVFSAIQITAANEFRGSNASFQKTLNIFAIIGMLLCLLRFIMMSINIEWWYGLACFFLASTICGIAASLLGKSGRLIVGTIGFAAIPVLWYMGGLF